MILRSLFGLLILFGARNIFNRVQWPHCIFTLAGEEAESPPGDLYTTADALPWSHGFFTVIQDTPSLRSGVLFGLSRVSVVGCNLYLKTCAMYASIQFIH